MPYSELVLFIIMLSLEDCLHSAFLRWNLKMITHVLLSNMYATARRWENATAIRQSMKKKGMKKEPGLSWIENQGRVHYFRVGDTSHPDI